MKRTHKKLLSGALALVLSLCLFSSAAMADEWFIDQGDITIEANENGQTVSQGGVSKYDDAPVITQTDPNVAVEHTITVVTTDDATAQFTVRDVNLYGEDVGYDGIVDCAPLIDVGDSRKVIISRIRRSFMSAAGA